MRQTLLFICLFIFAQTVRSQVSYTWNGSLSTAWNVAGNWTPNGIPGNIDNVTIITGSNTCSLNTTTSITNITLTSGTLDLGGFTLTVGGATAIFTKGTVQNGALTIAGATTTTFGNGPVVMNCAVNITSGAITIKGTTFQSITTITKNGASNDNSGGSNIFNGVTTITNNGAGQLLLGNGNPDQFNTTATFNNTGANNFYIAWNTAGNVFGGVTTFNNAPTTNNGMYVSWNAAGTTFNDNIVVASTAGQGVQFCGGNGTATATLAATKTINIGGAGFTAGTLLLRQFTQTGATAQNIALTGAGALNIGPSTVFGGDVTASSPSMYLNGATFNGVANLTKTGTTGDFSNGGNLFNGVCSITNSGSSFLVLGNNNPDTWNNDVTFTDNGSERLLPCWGSTGNQFNGNIIVNTAGSAQGIQFCGGNNTATATLAATKTIQTGAIGLTAGYLYLKQFTQSGNAPIALTATGTSVLYLGPSSSFGGTFTATSPDIWAQGAIYNSAAVFTKTGGTSNHNNQNQNIFNSTCTINQQSSTGYFMLGYNSNDLFNDNITVTCTGSGGIYLGWQSGTGTPTLAAGKTISVGPAGFNSGFLSLNTFSQLGNAPINLNFTGANTLMLIARSSAIGGTFTVQSPRILMNGALFSDSVNLTKTGATGEWSAGGNIFNSTLTVTHLGSGYFGFANGSPDIYNGDVYVNNNSTERIIFGNNPTGNQFNGNIILTQTGSSVGTAFGWSATTDETQAAGKTISIGAAGFSTGFLQIERFTQLGNKAVNLPLTGNASLTFGPTSAFGGDVTASSPTLYLNGCTFNGVSTLTKTGVTGDFSQGGNIFNGVCSITNSGSSFLVLGNNNPDTWNNDVTFTDNGSERLLPCWSATGNQFNGNIFVNTSGSAWGIQFCGGNNTATATLAATKTIQAGAGGLNAGYLILRQFTQLGNAAVNLTLSSTATYLQYGPLSAFGGDVTSSSPGLYFNGCTFNGAVTSTKTGLSNDNSSGNNIFNGVTTLTDNGGGQLLLGNGNSDQFNTTATFNNAGSNNIYVAYNSPNNVFGGVTTFNNTPTANNLIYVSWNSAGTTFADNIVVSSTNGQGVQFCGGNGSATATLAATKTISIGAGGFSAGTLLLRQFTQVGATTQSLLLTGTGNLTYGPNSSFGGDMTSSSPTLFLNGCTFNGISNITKTGATGDFSQGGNIFNGICSITNSGSSFLVLGNNNPDTWNNDVTFTDNGSERLLPCWSATGNQFNGNIFVNTAGSAQGIQFCGGNNSATATLAATMTIQAGAGGLNAGYLILKQFTQLGNAAVNLTLSSTATYLQYGPLSAIGGDVTSSSPGLYFNGCTFNGAATCTKTGASNDNSAGNNIFNGVATMTSTGSGYLLFGNGNRDQFNSTATFNNMGSSNMYVAYNSTNNIFGGVTTFNNTPTTNTLIYVSPYSAGTIFNNNIVVTSTNGQGVQFCTGNNTATATLASGNTISVGAGGFSAGTLLLRQFTQAAGTPQSLTLTGSGNLTFGPSSAFGGNVTSVSPTLLFNGCNFGGTVNSLKNGGTNDASIGNNIFNGAFSVTNTGAGNFLMGNGNPDLWQSTATFNNLSTGQHMYVAYNSTGNIFNGDVLFNNQPAAAGLWIYTNNFGVNTQFNGNISVENVNGGGVYFGQNTGTATLASGHTISVGAAGFNSGGLIFRNFTQTGLGTAQNIITTGTSYIQYGTAASFDGAVTSTSPGLFFNGSSFNGTVNCTKTGTTNDQSQGNNIFNGAGTFTNNGTGYLLMTVTTPDAYNSDVTFVQNGTGLVYPNYNGNSNYAGNLTVTSPAATAIVFGSGTGTATFSGSGGQAINATGVTAVPVFTRLVIANTGSGVTLNSTSINVSGNLQLTSGLLNSSTTYILTMLNGSTTAAGTALSTSYVNGPMRYIKSTAGITTLNFPIGTGADCRPVALTVNHTNGTQYDYQAQLFDISARSLNYTLPPSVDRVSDFRYYTINRTNAALVSQPSTGLVGNQTIQIFFGANDSVSNGATLTIVKNTSAAPTAWINIGGAGGPAVTGSGGLIGSITSTSSPSAFNSFSTFALADQIGGGNVLPVGLLYFNAKPDNNAVDLGWATSAESNNDYFTIERSKDGLSFDSLEKVDSKAINGNSNTELDYVAQDPSPFSGTSYYRLKQTNLDGKFTYSNIVSVNFDRKPSVAIYPNPTTGTVYVGGLDISVNSLQAQWFDVSGKYLLGETVPVQGGIARLDAHFNNGVYLLRVMASDGTFKLVNVIILK